MKTFMKLLLVAVATFLNLAPATPANQLRSQDQEKKWEEMEIWGDICKKTISWLSDANDLAGAECDRLADSLLSLHKPSVRSYLIAAQVANLREKPNKAISILEELISKYPNENAIIMSHPVKIVGRFWIATIAKQSGDIVKAKDVYENLLSILSTAENVKGVRDKGGLSLTMICNLYLAEIESLHLKRNDVALARLEAMQQNKKPSGQMGAGYDMYKNWAKYQHTKLSKGKTQAAQQMTMHPEMMSGCLLALTQLTLCGMTGTPLDDHSSDKRINIVSDVLLNRIIKNSANPIDRQLAMLGYGFDQQYRKNSANAEKFYSALLQEDSFFSPLAGINLAQCKKAQNNLEKADEVLDQVNEEYPGYGSIVARIRQSWKK